MSSIKHLKVLLRFLDVIFSSKDLFSSNLFVAKNKDKECILNLKSSSSEG